MTKEEYGYIQDLISEVQELILSNRSKEFIASVYDDYFSESEEKDMLCFSAMMREAVHNSRSILKKLDDLTLYAYESSCTPEELVLISAKRKLHDKKPGENNE